ncbi:54S ribosomal protein L23, mitochondrial [Aspergillus alliaceus]|uniref:Large ribosomal subunit protein uL23m n=1 Tax=Petromyces alliaceus TaxID=209559 RepID=A0A5N7CJL5_PETAA|nr:ribosomal protein L23-domain-containing protein [Aspergillus alliaceus]KAB8229098.1 ribosomal protein L23-domain-containing protein [Aspergillus alliaceus]KAE8394059.1 ribosomal protein L23-domain-containing protein [Aspergillus alliaceus]KAF5861827.1 54S ribosomal protein L23, mitochondrial [Aspergillus burnettii]
MVRQFSKFPKKPADWLSPSAPLSMRKQVYLPDFTIALIRTPFLPPRYASFYVPLSFNKLDMRDYMQRVYGVDVISVRSYVEQQKVTRLRPQGKFGYGKIRRPMSKKKMTIEMTQPFVWPEAPKDMSDWEHNQFHAAEKYQSEIQDMHRPDAGTKVDTASREAYAEEAKKLLDGSKTWRPTWQALGLSYDRTGLGKSSTSS